MIKKILSSIILLTAILFSVNIVNAASGRADITTSATSVKPGDTFTVTLSANSQDGVFGVQTTYNYDSSKLDLVKAEVASNKYIDMSGGKSGVVEVMSNSQEKFTSENVYVLTFKAKDNAQIGSTATIATGDIKVSGDKSGTGFTETAKSATVNISGTTQTTPGTNNGNNGGNGNENNSGSENTGSGLNNNSNNSGFSGITGNTNNGTTTSGSKTGTTNTNTSNATNSLANKVLPKTGEERNKVLLIIFIGIAVVCSLFFYIKTNKIKKMYR